MDFLNVQGCSSLSSLAAASNSFVTLDLSTTNVGMIQLQYCHSLKYLFIKNGRSSGSKNLSYCNHLQYVCADEDEIQQLLTLMNQPNYVTFEVNSYCSIPPGNNINRITGDIQFDATGICAPGLPFPYVRIPFKSNGTTTSHYSDVSGQFNAYVTDGVYDFSVELENPSFFEVSPAAASVTVPSDMNPHVQNFCITPVGTHTDLEVVIIPMVDPRPGFSSTYRILYRNNGNHPKDGIVAF
jgi:hypothetical protein